MSVVIPYYSTSDMFSGNINDLTEQNTYYRRVIATTPNMQLVLMSLLPNEEIGTEIHPYVTQFIRIETGDGLAIINNESYPLYDGSAVVIPAGSQHNIINISTTQSMKLYTIYSPPNHPNNRLDVIKPIND